MYADFAVGVIIGAFLISLILYVSIAQSVYIAPEVYEPAYQKYIEIVEPELEKMPCNMRYSEEFLSSRL